MVVTDKFWINQHTLKFRGQIISNNAVWFNKVKLLLVTKYETDYDYEFLNDPK